MNRVTKRTWIMGLFLAVLLGGMMFFLWEYVTQAGEWVTFPGSPHVYNNANIGCGTVTDRSGNVLLDITEERTYSSDAATRRSTLHWLGDRKGYISASAVSHYAGKMAGFDLVSGVYDSSGEGGEMTLTLSARVQNAALDAMAGRKGTVGVYNYKTGEILCALTTPTYDPDNVPDIASDTSGQYDGVYLNRFLQSTYVPGSIFKVVTTAAALDCVPDILDKTFTCYGAYEYGTEKVTCEKAHGTLTLKTALANSCNCAFAEISLELGPDIIAQYAEKLGITTSLTLDSIFTQAGNYDKDSSMSASMAWSGIGQYNDLVCPYAMMRLAGAYANGGTVVEPSLLGQSSKTTQLVSADTAQKIASMMNYNVVYHYGQNRFPGLNISAKTGTAEVGDGKAAHGWFVGFLNDEAHPYAFVCLVENGGSGLGAAGSVINTVLQAAVAK